MKEKTLKIEQTKKKHKWNFHFMDKKRKKAAKKLSKFRREKREINHLID